jgi:DNA-binding transcriptional MerR regulator/effector-binding domain-containing protein
VVSVMITIGDFARLGRVSVRMLRHYDEIGLLRPDHVDPSSGYRYYTREQLPLLNRIVALKDLGLKLEQVRAVVSSELTGDELRAMLRLRQAEITTQIQEEQHRLARVQARLRLIDAEDSMNQPAIVTKQVPAVRHVGLSAPAASATPEDVGPVIQPLYGQVIGALQAADVTPVGPSIAYYEPAPDVSEDALTVYVTFPVPVDEVSGLKGIEVPAAEVASYVYRGSMDGIDAAYQTLLDWVRSNGRVATGSAREVYLEVPMDSSEWVTEVQLDLAP